MRSRPTEPWCWARRTGCSARRASSRGWRRRRPPRPGARAPARAPSPPARRAITPSRRAASRRLCTAANEGGLDVALAVTERLLDEDPLDADAHFITRAGPAERGRCPGRRGLASGAPCTSTLTSGWPPSRSAGLTRSSVTRAAASRSYEQALRTLEPEDARHEPILEQVDLGRRRRRVRPARRGAESGDAVKILIVDDSPTPRLILRRELEGLGHECIMAEDGNQALESFRAFAPDVIVSDWMMPGMDGDELCRRVRADPSARYVYFILLTSLDDRASVVKGMEAGADDHLAKTFERSELQTRLIAAERVTALHHRLAAQQVELERLERDTPGRLSPGPSDRAGQPASPGRGPGAAGRSRRPLRPRLLGDPVRRRSLQGLQRHRGPSGRRRGAPHGGRRTGPSEPERGHRVPLRGRGAARRAAGAGPGPGRHRGRADAAGGGVARGSAPGARVARGRASRSARAWRPTRRTRTTTWSSS